MKDHLQLFTETDRKKFLSHRYDLTNEEASKPEDNSSNFATAVELCEDLEQLGSIKATYVIIGIPEDIGVRANFGRPGASEAWEAFLTSFLALQHSSINDAERFCILGKVHTEDLMEKAQGLDASDHKERREWSQLLRVLDERVCAIVSKIIEADKIPIIIGGGHNNCYPIINALGHSEAIDCINIDAHTDLRTPNGRHSGNGFSLAKEKGFLGNYYMIGIQENYLSQPMIDLIRGNSDFDYFPYTTHFSNLNIAVDKALTHIDSDYFGLEIDMDVVAHFPSSAQSPIGFTLETLRKAVQQILEESSSLPKYIHICEAAPRYGYSGQVGKALAAIINDLP